MLGIEKQWEKFGNEKNFQIIGKIRIKNLMLKFYELKSSMENLALKIFLSWKSGRKNLVFEKNVISNKVEQKI